MEDDLGCLVMLGLYKLLRKAIGGDRYLMVQNQDMLDISVRGRTIEIIQCGEKPDIELRFAAADGERLYRELGLHYPSAVSKQEILERQVSYEVLRKDGF